MHGPIRLPQASAALGPLRDRRGVEARANGVGLEIVECRVLILMLKKGLHAVAVGCGGL